MEKNGTKSSHLACSSRVRSFPDTWKLYGWSSLLVCCTCMPSTPILQRTVKRCPTRLNFGVQHSRKLLNCEEKIKHYPEERRLLCWKAEAEGGLIALTQLPLPEKGASPLLRCSWQPAWPGGPPWWTRWSGWSPPRLQPSHRSPAVASGTPIAQEKKITRSTTLSCTFKNISRKDENQQQRRTALWTALFEWMAAMDIVSKDSAGGDGDF